MESIVEDRFSGEPFRRCDVHLDHPQIGIARTPPSPIAVEILGGSRIEQFGPSAGADTALEKTGRRALVDRDNEYRAPLRITFRHYRAEPAGIVDAAQKRADEHATGEAITHDAVR